MLDVGHVGSHDSQVSLSKFNQSKISVMSKKEAERVNNAFRSMIKIAAVAMAIVALIYNPYHLFTACLMYAFSLETQIVEPDDFDF